jgi:C-terminal processing protease CtpA/Prc
MYVLRYGWVASIENWVGIFFHLFTEELSGIFVKSISEGSAADLCKKIQVNDRIVEVCNAQNDLFI